MPSQHQDKCRDKVVYGGISRDDCVIMLHTVKEKGAKNQPFLETLWASRVLMVSSWSLRLTLDDLAPSGGTGAGAGSGQKRGNKIGVSR